VQGHRHGRWKRGNAVIAVAAILKRRQRTAPFEALDAGALIPERNTRRAKDTVVVEGQYIRTWKPPRGIENRRRQQRECVVNVDDLRPFVAEDLPQTRHRREAPGCRKCCPQAALPPRALEIVVADGELDYLVAVLPEQITLLLVGEVLARWSRRAQIVVNEDDLQTSTASDCHALRATPSCTLVTLEEFVVSGVAIVQSKLLPEPLDCVLLTFELIGSPRPTGRP